MSKKPRGKDSDYLRFRPYHAFTSPAVEPADATWRKALWRSVLLLGGLALMIAAALWLSHR
jgi:hypothetical protein